MRILAIIAAHNEGDVIYHVIRDLLDNEIAVYLIDDGSTDNTVAEAERLLGRGLINIERIPAASSSHYVWRDLLARKEQVAREINPDWCIHADADEFREPPWTGMSLCRAIELVDEAGYNAIDFELHNFRPTSNSFVPGTDVRKSLIHYETGLDCDRVQIKAWKHYRDVPVDLVSSGGHDATFAGRMVFPIPFILRHYPIRSLQHMQTKLGQERGDRFDSLERSAGWHVQYDNMKAKDAKLWNPTDLRKYDAAAVRLQLLDAYTRKESAYDRYVASLLEERSRLRSSLLAERAEVGRIAKAERVAKAERERQLRNAEDELAQLTIRFKRRDIVLSEICLRLLAKSKKRIAIWGAGGGGVKALNCLQHLLIHVDAFIDRDKKKIGGFIRKHPVISPTSLKKKSWRREVTAVFIASIASEQIENYLEGMGWKEGVDYFSLSQIILDQYERPLRQLRSKRK
jgi:glycosyltransferase involved in cell wall biosynthesis